MKTTVKPIRRFLWAFIVGFMIAWHNVYFQDDCLREEDTIEIALMEEDEHASSADFPSSFS